MQSMTKVVVCGSYHRSTDQLERIIFELEATSCRILSPLSIDFIDDSSSVVKLKSEEFFSVAEIEKFHLRAIAECDLVWLHNPDGYVGVMGAFELGYAYNLRKPIYGFEAPYEAWLKDLVQVVPSVFNALLGL